jgi:hypothetical protein
LKEVIRKRAELLGEEGFNRLCSMFAVWGPRSAGGQLFSARNLDWEKDTGISAFVCLDNDYDHRTPFLTLAAYIFACH